MIRIVVMEQKFVSVGVYSEAGESVVLENARIIRYWGTSRGLGELAEGGPTAKTILDPTPKQTIPRKSVVFTMDCDVEKWAKVLGVEAKKKRRKA